MNNEDLRHMMNEINWYAAKETVKNKASEKPTAAEEHVVDLRKAINEPMEPSVPHTIDLYKAIQQEYRCSYIFIQMYMAPHMLI